MTTYNDENQDPSASERARAAAEMAHILELMGGKDALDAARTPAASGIPTTQSPSDVDKLLRGASDEQRAAFVAQYEDGVYPPKPKNGDLDFASRNGEFNWDQEQRLTQLREEIPTSINTGGLLASTWGWISDFAGKPLGKALELMDLPAQAVEDYVGMSWFNELPLAERHAAARLAYDSIWADLFRGGNTRHEIAQDVSLGLSHSELDAKYNDAWVTGIGHFILDPLWLLGGVPLVEAAFKATRFAPAARVIGRGVNLSKVLPEIRADIPIVSGLYDAVRNIGNPIEDRMLAHNLAALNDPRGLDDIAALRQTGKARTLTGPTLAARVDTDKSHITNLFGGLGMDPKMWDNGVAGAVDTPMFKLVSDIGDGLLTRTGLEESTAFKNTQIILQDSQLRGALSGMESLRPLSNNAFWDDAKHMLKTERDGVETTIPALMRNREALTPLEEARYAGYRTTKFLLEFEDKGMAGLRAMHKVEEPTALHNALEGIDRVTSGMKYWLSATVLNTPSFAVMNYINNISMIALKANDLGAAVRYTVNPWKFSKSELGHLSALGSTQDSLRALSSDSSFQLEFRPELLGNDPDKWRRRGHKLAQAATAMVGVASRFDQGARDHVLVKGMRDAAVAVWKTGDGGVLDDLPETLRGHTQYASWRDGLAFKNVAEVDRADNLLMHSDDFIDAHGLASQWARAQSKSDQEASLLMLNDAFLDEVNDVVDMVRTNRRARGAEALTDIGPGLDDIQDGLDLKVFEQAMEAGFEPKPIPLSTVRDKIAPWQDTALFIENQTHYREIASRAIAASLGNTPRGRAIQGNVIGRMETYDRRVRALLEEARFENLDRGRLTTLARDWRKLIDERDAAIRAQFARSGGVPPAIESTLRAEREAFDA